MRGFSLIEVLIAMLFLAIALLGLLWLNQMSGRSAMDAQYELLALSLAQEPIEVFQNLGYRWVRAVGSGNIAGLDEYPLAWKVVRDPPFATVQRPVEAGLFQRRIELTPLQKDGLAAIRMVVTVMPVAQTRVISWLSRNQVTLEALIVDRPR